MFRTPPPAPVIEDLTARTTPETDRPEAPGCSVCGLARAEHGVHLLHRYVLPSPSRQAADPGQQWGSV